MSPKLKHTLIGCGIAICTLFLVWVASCVGFIVWLNRPGTLLRPEALMDGETTGFVAWTFRSEDAGMRHVLEKMIEKSQREQRSHSPFPRWIADPLQNIQTQRSRSQISGLFPFAAVWTARPGSDPDSDLQIMTFSLPRAGNRLVLADSILGRMMGWSHEVKTESYQGESIYTIPLTPDVPVTFFIRGSDVFITSDADTARVAIDRITAAGPTAAVSPDPDASDLTSLYARTPEGSAMRGAIVNGHGEIARLLQRVVGDEEAEVKAIEERWQALAGLTISGAFTNENTFAALLEFLGPDEPWARENAAALDSDCRSLLEHAAIQATTTPAQDGRWVRVAIQIDDPASQLETLLDFEKLAPRHRERESTK